MRLFCLLLGWLLATPLLAANLTLEELVALRSVNELTISPKGRFVAYLRLQPRDPLRDDDGPAWNELYVADMMGNSRPFVTGKVRLSQLRWSADGRRLLFVAKRGADKHRALYAIAIDGGEAQRIAAPARDVEGYALSSDNRSLYLIAKDKEPDTKAKLKKHGFIAQVYEEQDEPSKLWRYALDEQGNISGEPHPLPINGHVMALQLSPQGDRLAIQASPSPRIDDQLMASELHITDQRGQLRHRLAHRGKLGAFRFNPSGDQLLFIGSEDEHDPAEGRLLLADVTSGKITDLLPDFAGHVAAIDWFSDRQPLYIAAINSSSRLAMLNIDNGNSTTLIAEQSGSELLRQLDASDNGQIALLADSWQHPTEAFVLPATSKTVQRLTISNPLLETRELASQQLITFKGKDGLELEGILVKPLRHSDGHRYPLLMFVHGGPEAHVANGWVSRYANPAQVAAAAGYASFFPNYRGSTGRGVAFSKLGQGDPAGAEFDDIVAAKEHLVAIGLADENKVGISGGSYGGYATAWGATAQSQHFAAGVMFVGLSDLISKFGTTDIPNEMYLVHERQWPWQQWQKLLERSPIYHAEKHRTPLLIMHGEEDTRVAPSQSLELYRYLKTLNQAPVRLVLYPGEGHGNKKAAAQLDYARRLMQWMDFYLRDNGKGLPADLDHSSALTAP